MDLQDLIKLTKLTDEEKAWIDRWLYQHDVESTEPSLFEYIEKIIDNRLALAIPRPGYDHKAEEATKQFREYMHKIYEEENKA